MGFMVSSVLPSFWSWSRCTNMETLLDALVLRACACPLGTKEEARTLRALAPACSRSSWLMSRGPREVFLASISPPLVSLLGEAAPEEVLHRPPRKCLECLVLRWAVQTCQPSHAAGCRQASVGTPVPRMLTLVSHRGIEANPEKVKGIEDMIALLVCVGVLGTGVPRLACLRPTAWLS